MGEMLRGALCTGASCAWPLLALMGCTASGSVPVVMTDDMGDAGRPPPSSDVGDEPPTVEGDGGLPPVELDAGVVADAGEVPDAGPLPNWPLGMLVIPGATGHADMPFIRITNLGDTPTSVRGTVFGESGAVLGSGGVALFPELAPEATAVLAATDLEGLVGTWSGHARLQLEGLDSNLAVMGLMRSRTSDTLANMSCASRDGSVPIVPKSLSPIDRSFIRITNLDDAATTVRGTLFSQDGAVLGEAGSVLVPAIAPGATTVLTSEMLEDRMGADYWSGRARLQITSPYENLAIVSLIRSIESDTLINMSCASRDGTAYNIPGASSALDDPFIRVTNLGDVATTVRGTIFAEDGSVLGEPDGVLIPAVAPDETAILSAEDLEERVGAWSGRARLQVTSDHEQLAVMSVFRNRESRALTNMSCVSRRGAAFNIPSSAAETDSAFIRVTNLDDEATSIRGTLFGEDGTPIGAANEFLVPVLRGGATIVLTPQALEEVLEVGPWTGRARLQITSRHDQIAVMSLIRSRASKTLVNMSCVDR